MINKDPLLFMTGDKSNNLCKVSKDNYNNLLQEKITKSYKKSNVALINNIKKETKAMATELKLNGRIDQFNQRGAFFTLKDHKVNFQNDPKCSLINLAKTIIGIISKHYLELNNNKIRAKTHMNQWHSTKSFVIGLKQSKIRTKVIL